MKQSVRVVFCLAICCVLLLALSALVEAGKPPPPPPPPPASKTVTMSTREDYDKGADLDDIALDFALINELDIDELICSFGWDDYEPTQGNYDFTWLNSFMTRAAQYGINLRPYICYAPAWAGDGNWNSPPNDINDWYNFCYNLGLETKNHSNVVSIEVWNEWNDAFWFNGTFAQYTAMLENAALALSAAYAPSNRCDIVLGGLVWPHYEAIAACTAGTMEQNYEIVPFHCYSETWPERDEVEQYLDSQYYDWFVPCVNNDGEGEPIWMNECGYSTMERPEINQAGYFVRAVSYFLSDAEIEHFTAYEIRNLDPNSPVIGDENNYYFGLVNFDRTKKTAFYTYDMLTDLLDNKEITFDNSKVEVAKVSGRFGKEYHYLFQVSDGSQIFVIYDKKNTVTAKATLTESESTCTWMKLDGTTQVWNDFNGTVINNIPLSSAAGDVFVFNLTTP